MCARVRERERHVQREDSGCWCADALEGGRRGVAITRASPCSPATADVEEEQGDRRRAKAERGGHRVAGPPHWG
jgi:hypothetical protein